MSPTKQRPLPGITTPSPNRYWVTTWDSDLDGWTPQNGVRTGPWTLWGLRKAIRKLRAMGYPCDYSSRGLGSLDGSHGRICDDA